MILQHSVHWLKAKRLSIFSLLSALVRWTPLSTKGSPFHWPTSHSPRLAVVLSCPVDPVLSCPVPSCPAPSRPVPSRPVPSRPVPSIPPLLFSPLLSCRVLGLSYPVLTFVVLWCPVLSCPVLSCPILSCLILSCPILSRPVCLGSPTGPAGVGGRRRSVRPGEAGRPASCNHPGPAQTYQPTGADRPTDRPTGRPRPPVQVARPRSERRVGRSV